MKSSTDEVKLSVANLRKVAAEIGISRNEQMLMRGVAIEKFVKDFVADGIRDSFSI